jgi:hypothetical protein
MNARSVSRSAVVWLTGVCALAAAHFACAQEPVIDPPGRVARLSVMDGEVQLAPASTAAGTEAGSEANEASGEEWTDAVLNRPLTSGDKLWVGADGRAELQVGTATVHLDRSTGFEFIELDDDVMQMSLTEGVATIRVRTLGERETVQVETPNATVKLRHPGEYTVQIDPDTDRTIVRTRNGEAEVTGASKSFRVRDDEEGVFTGLDGLTAKIGPLSRRTAFEDWANDRDRRSERSESGRYVSNEVVGYEDLDGQGEWIDEPEYGHVWRPLYVANDWAPYRYGRWAFVAPWGWTWIDDARWGFAPFHYGRWAFVRHRWCWVPGPRHLRPYYAPALVGWVGGPSVGVSVSFGSGVGWFPLAPHEVYRPWYRHTPRYVRHVNVSNTIIVNNINVTNVHGRPGQPRYRNRAVMGAVTAVHRDSFVSGRPVGAQRIHVNDRELRQWRDNVRPTAIAPDRQSVLAGQPRREPPPRQASFANENRQLNPKRGGDFRAARPGMNRDQIKRVEDVQREQSSRDRVALREQAQRERSPERIQSLRSEPRAQNPSRPQDSPRMRDHVNRPPPQALQSNPSSDASERSRAVGREREDVRDNPGRFERRQNIEPRNIESVRPRQEQNFQRRDEPTFRREVREQPRQREWTGPTQSREPAPQRQMHSAPAERSQPRAEAPRVETRSHATRSSDTNSSRPNRAGQGPKADNRDRHSRPQR